MSYVKRLLSAHFELGEGDFGLKGVNGFTLDKHRMRADITWDGALQGNLGLVIYGMPLDLMQRLTVLNKLASGPNGITASPINGRQNKVTVSAGDDEKGMSVVFDGTIAEAWADFKSPPDGKFILSAFTALLDTTKPAQPASFKGSISAVAVIKQIASRMTPPHAVENSGVEVMLPPSYFPGTLIDQLTAACKAADINCVIENGDLIAIWPKGKSRQAQEVMVSADTGMIGYPAFTQNGIRVETIFNPNLVFGRNIQLKSLLGAANGKWRVDAVSHNLESETPGGGWETQIECGLLGAPVALTTGG